MSEWSEVLEAVVQQACTRDDVPGMIAGVWSDGVVHTAAAGVANLATGVPMTTDTAYLTGSITKVWAATLAMIAVDRGELALDDTLRTLVPEVQFGADAEVAASLTVRHLLNHSSGVDAADLLIDTGPYDGGGFDALLRCLAEVGSIHAPGRYASYNNAGWVVLDAVLRQRCGAHFHNLLRDRLIGPLGLRRTVCSPDEAILHRTAIGHLPAAKAAGLLEPTPRFSLPQAYAAAGATLITTVEDSLSFLAMHLHDGRARGGRLLTQASAWAMRTPTMPDPTGPATGFGLGWRYAGGTAADRPRDPAGHWWHAGGSFGGLAIAGVVPDSGVAYAAFVNSSVGIAPLLSFQHRVAGGSDAELPAVPPPADGSRTADARPERVVDAGPVEGVYRRKSLTMHVCRAADGYEVEQEPHPEEFTHALLFSRGQPLRFTAVPTGPSTLISREPVFLGMHHVLTFLEPDARGVPQLLYAGSRLAPRIA